MDFVICRFWTRSLNRRSCPADLWRVSRDAERRERIRALFARAEDPYAGGDIQVARRLSAALWCVGIVLTWLLMPLSPPTEALGPVGWAVVAVLGVTGFLASRWIVKHGVTWNFLLVSCYLGVAQLALLEWLAGGVSSPYGELYLLIALPAGGIHPPRRVLPVLGFIGVALALPLLYEPTPAAQVGSTILQFILLSAIAVLAAGLMRQVRAQRVALRESGEAAERLARVDELTGLPNRRAFTEALTTEIARARRFGSPLSLIIGDLDHFKEINDEYGHPAGDACLRLVADALRGTLRQYDTCFRWGGDEFALVLPGTSAAEADQAVHRVATAVSGCRDAGGAPLQITCAPAELDDTMIAGYDLLAAADAVLLERKRARGSRLLQSA